MKKVTLVQQVANLKEYYQMRKVGQLPLVLSLTNEQMSILLEAPVKDSMSIKHLYIKAYMRNEEGVHYLHLRGHVLRKLIEQGEICIPEFLDFNKKTKFVDYITADFSVDVGPFIVFRGTKRLFEKNQAKYSLQKNTDKKQGLISTFISSIDESKETEEEEFENLCVQAIYQERENNQGNKRPKQFCKSFDEYI